jgi:hypothetical protein
MVVVFPEASDTEKKIIENLQVPVNQIIALKVVVVIT